MMSMMKSRMKTKSLVMILICGLSSILTGSLTAAVPSDESDVRNAIQHTFDQLKNGQYAALYDSLPSSTRSRLPKDRFVNGLQRSQGFFQLQRIDIGPVRVSGDIAVPSVAAMGGCAATDIPSINFIAGHANVFLSGTTLSVTTTGTRLTFGPLKVDRGTW